MNLITFKKFEFASKILEDFSPMEVSDEVLSENNITLDELTLINEGIVGDAISGLFKGLKQSIIKKIPGSILKKADAIIKDYEDTKSGISEKILKERNKIYKADINAEENSGDATLAKRSKEIRERSERAIKDIEAGNKTKLESIEKQLKLLTKDKSEETQDYVDFKLAEAKERIATKQLENAQNDSSEEDLEKLENEVKSAKKVKEDAANALKSSLDNTKKKKNSFETKSEDVNKGETWKRISNDGKEQEVVIQGDVDGEGMVDVKEIKKGTKFKANVSSLKEKIK